VNTSGVVTKSVFQNGSGYGINASNTSGATTLKVMKNTFTGVSTGVRVVGSGGSVSAKVSGNNLTGSTFGVYIVATPPGTATASVTGNNLQGVGTGIQVTNVNKPKIIKNKLDGFYYGISLIDSSKGKIIRNRVRGGYGIAVVGDAVDANSNKVLKNTIELIFNNIPGIYLEVGTGLETNFNQIKNNTITDPGDLYTGTFGIYLNNSTGGSMDGTVLKSNKLIHMDTPYVHLSDTNTVIKSNTCTPSSPCVTP